MSVLHLVYNFGIRIYGLGIRIASFFHPKARLAIQGRSEVFTLLRAWKKSNPSETPIAWFHCASLGEFEQGRPLIEALRAERPDVKIVLTFFSPSGYEVRKKYAGADLVLYLPFDYPSHAAQWVSELQPTQAVFVKYEYWPNFFLALSKHHIPLFIVSGIFREGHRFFGWQRTFWKKILGCVTTFHLQNERSARLLATLGFTNSIVAGDTRFDRVLQIATEAKVLPIADTFCGDHPVLIAGSSYDAEEEIVQSFMYGCPQNWKAIVVPHEIDEAHIQSILLRFGNDAITWSAWTPAMAKKRVLVVDQMGLLSALFRYGRIALIGGGFGKGLHNTLEAAVYGIPVAFGPRYHKFDEACALLAGEGGFSADDKSVMTQHLLLWAGNEELRHKTGQKAAELVASGKGAVAVALEILLNKL